MSKNITNRLKRLSGQLHKLQETIENKQDCAEVIPQFLAVKGGLAAAFETYVKEALDDCQKTDRKKLTNLIKQLTRA
jgi:DNA-binding FrmR family transcriptional regulator